MGRGKGSVFFYSDRQESPGLLNYLLARPIANIICIYGRDYISKNLSGPLSIVCMSVIARRDWLASAIGIAKHLV